MFWLKNWLRFTTGRSIILDSADLLIADASKSFGSPIILMSVHAISGQAKVNAIAHWHLNSPLSVHKKH